MESLEASTASHEACAEELKGFSPDFWQQLRRFEHRARVAEQNYEAAVAELLRCNSDKQPPAINDVWNRYCQATDALACATADVAAHVERSLQPE